MEEEAALTLFEIVTYFQGLLKDTLIFQQIFYFSYVPHQAEKLSPLKSSRLIYKWQLCFRHGDVRTAPERVSCPAILCRDTEALRYTWLIVTPFCPAWHQSLSKETLDFISTAPLCLAQGVSVHNTCRNSCQSSEMLLAKLIPSLNGLCRDQKVLC